MVIFRKIGCDLFLFVLLPSIRSYSLFDMSGIIQKPTPQSADAKFQDRKADSFGVPQ